MKHSNYLAGFIGLMALLSIPLSSSQARDINMVAVNWAPYYGKSLKNEGVIADLVKTSFKRSGHTAKIEWVPWKRAVYLVEQGLKDVALGAYYSDERARTFRLSDAFYNIEVGFVALRKLGVTGYSSLTDLSPYKIGVNAGWANRQDFDEASYLRKEPAKSPKHNILKLLKGRVQIITLSFGIFKYELSQMKARRLDEFVFLTPPLATKDLHNLISRKIPDSEKIASDFNRGLAKIKSDGTYSKILAEHGF